MRPYDTDDDRELVARSLDGDRRAFGRLVRRHDPAMRRLAGRLVDSGAAMDDVLQDAYLKAFRGLPAFDGRSSFATWLYSITYRTAVDHLRRASVRQTSPLTEEMTEAGPGGSPDSIADRLAERSLLRKALSELPPDQAAAVLLVHGEGLSYQDAAKVLEVAPGTVGSRVNRARAVLKDQLGSMYGGGAS